MQLVLTPVVFALRWSTAISDCFAVKKRKFRASKKPTVGFLQRGFVNDSAPWFDCNHSLHLDLLAACPHLLDVDLLVKGNEVGVHIGGD